MKITNTKTYNFDAAIRGMRNPMESWTKSDSYWTYIEDTNTGDLFESQFFIGDKDLELAQKLIKGGSEHRKFMRQMIVCVDITAPMYVWSELDTYQVGVTKNSTSKMHKLSTTPITLECFETDDRDAEAFDYDIEIVNALEKLRQKYLETKDKRYWKELVRWLPESWLQTRTVTLSYENLRNIYFQRQNHKLSEWKTICNWIEDLPYAKELICYEG